LDLNISSSFESSPIDRFVNNPELRNG